MDSMERLSHSLEQAVALIQSLRRESRALAREAAEAKAASLQAVGLEKDLAQARQEIENLSREPAEDLVSAQRAGQAELEAARLAEEMDALKRQFAEEKRRLEGKVQELELLLLQASREEIMPLPPQPDRGGELESLARRCAELEVMLSERHNEVERLNGAVTGMQVKIAESANADEVVAWQLKITALEAENEELIHLRDLKAQLEADRQELRRQKKALAAIRKEREMTRMKLEEIHATLDLMRLA